MLLAIPPRTEASLRKPAPAGVTPAGEPEWVQVALTGSAADLRRLLDRGMKPDARTEQGTTALMLAARDIEKVKLLLDRGADVNARAASGITPLMVAARYRGNAEVVRLLLKKGAKPNADKGVEIRNDASAMFFAVMAGDTQTIEVQGSYAQPLYLPLVGHFLGDSGGNTRTLSASATAVCEQ